jgi:hypothetical protein
MLLALLIQRMLSNVQLLVLLFYSSWIVTEETTTFLIIVNVQVPIKSPPSPDPKKILLAKQNKPLRNQTIKQRKLFAARLHLKPTRTRSLKHIDKKTESVRFSKQYNNCLNTASIFSTRSTKVATAMTDYIATANNISLFNINNNTWQSDDYDDNMHSAEPCSIDCVKQKVLINSKGHQSI